MNEQTTDNIPESLLARIAYISAFIPFFGIPLFFILGLIAFFSLGPTGQTGVHLLSKGKNVFAIHLWLAIAFVIFLPSVMAFFASDFFEEEVFRAQSPDGVHEVVLKYRLAFPAIDFIDPEIVVNAYLADVKTKTYSEPKKLTGFESSDIEDELANPSINWTDDKVTIKIPKYQREIVAAFNRK